jgi:hypothetical protein
MLDLEHLDTLDDPAPAEPDLASLHRRAARKRTRNRLAAGGAGIAVLAGALMLLAAYPRPSASHRAMVSSPTTSSATLADGLHGELRLETPSVDLGDNVKATFVVRNDTGKTVDVTNDGILDCDFGLRAFLIDPRGVGAIDGGHDVACRGLPDKLEPGESRNYPVTLSTDNLDVATQTYHLTVENDAGTTLPELPVTVTPPP